MSRLGRPQAVLFDLDGTLVDTAPDLLDALDHARARLGLAPADHGRLREFVSRGAAGLLEAGLPELPEAEIERARERLLEHYQRNFWCRSAPFPGIDALLADLHRAGIGLGVVTNKLSRFALPVLEAAGWRGLFGSVVSGDRVARAKPDPQAVLLACSELGVAPERAIFVGDDERDTRAGRAAGTATVAAAWGYLPTGAVVAEWGADVIVDHAAEIADLVLRPERAGRDAG